MALRRAYADEYAERVNRAAVLLRRLLPADAVRALQAEFGLSELPDPRVRREHEQAQFRLHLGFGESTEAWTGSGPITSQNAERCVAA
jgi:hypothetical protein